MFRLACNRFSSCRISKFLNKSLLNDNFHSLAVLIELYKLYTILVYFTYSSFKTCLDIINFYMYNIVI